MAAIEYGSYYWCVVLNGKDGDASGESIFLHADDLAIEANGSLSFKSAGRRPTGSDPQKQEGKQGEKDPGKDPKENKGSEPASMIYVAFAPGTWRVVFAAKLQDGTPASIEHWNTADANAGSGTTVPPNSGAAGYVPPASSS